MLVDSAVDFAKRGWSVIPLRPDSKIPQVEWSQWQTRRADEAQIRQWWTNTPNANIGVVTGAVSGLVVVDVDPTHGGSASPIYNAHPTAVISRTGSGGSHLFYRYPSGAEWVPNRTSVKVGIDVRADGGYVVAPPSITSIGAYSWIQEGELSQPPTWAIVRDTVGHTSGGEKWLSELMSGVQEGQRNDAMARLVGYFAAKDIPRDVAHGMVTLWNQNNDNPQSLRTSEIEATVNSVYRTATRRKKHKSASATPNATNAMGKPLFAVQPLERYASHYGGAQVNWAIDDWLPQGTIGFVVSPPGTFKTWLLIDLAVSIASGKPFLGMYDVHDAGPVLFCQQEDDHSALVDRFARVLQDRYNIVQPECSSDQEFNARLMPHLPIYVHPDRGLRFDDPEVLERFVAMVRRIRPKLVIIDPLYTAVSVDGYMVDAAEQMLILKTLRDELGTTFMIAHHTRKTASESGSSTDRIDAWGSQFLNAFLETGWQIRATDDPKVTKMLRHFKVGGIDEIGLKWNIDDNIYRITELDAGDGALDRFNPVTDLLAVKAMGIRPMARQLKWSIGRVQRMVAQAVKLGVVEKHDKLYRLALPGGDNAVQQGEML